MNEPKQPSPNRGVFQLQITQFDKKGDRWGLLHGIVRVMAWNKDQGEYEIGVNVKCKVFAPWVTRLPGTEGQVVTVHFDFSGSEWEGKKYLNNYTVTGIYGLVPVGTKPPTSAPGGWVQADAPPKATQPWSEEDDGSLPF